MDSTACSVCSVRDVTLGLHYGAVTCYACRAFFRRCPERKRTPRCKYQSRCLIDEVVQHCVGCRLEKCLSVGMKLDLVLNEEERGERFKVFNEKKKREDKSENASQESVSSFGQTNDERQKSKVKITSNFDNYATVPFGTISSLSRRTNFIETIISSLPHPYILSGLEPTLPQPKNVSPKPPDLNTVPLLQHSELSNSQQNDNQSSFSHHKLKSSYSTYFPPQTPGQKNAAEADGLVKDKNIMIVSNPQSRKSVIQVLGKAKEGHEKYPSKEEFNQNVCNIEEVILEGLTEDDETTFKYIHKKFNNQNTERNQAQLKYEKQSQTNGMQLATRKRECVIVKHSSTKISRMENMPGDIFGDDLEIYNLEFGQPRESMDDLQLCFDIPAISSMCRQYLVQEELTYLTTIQHTFQQTWGEINLGERIMADYIRFCETKKDFSFEFIQLCNKQLRERYLNFLCSLELGEDVSKGTMVKLFKENLGKAEMLRYVHVFNIPHWSEELEFVFGQKDMDQWKRRDPSIAGISLMKVMQFMPIPEETKYGMYTQLAESSMPVFKDRTVFILMVLLTVFDLESDESVRKLRTRFLSILRRYLEENTKNYVDYDMDRIIKCTKNLSLIHKILRGK